MKNVWSLIPLKTTFDPDLFHSFVVAVESLTPLTCLPPCGSPGDVFSWVCWCLWTTRNQLLFEARPASAQITATKALTNALEWSQAQVPLTDASKDTQIAVTLHSIPADTVTCRTDAAWKKETSEAGLAWIFDSCSSLTASDGCQYQSRVSYVLMAEGLAVREALSHAQHIGITKIWIKSDSLSLVKAINSISKPRMLYGVLSDIKSLSSSFGFCCFSHIPRLENGLADGLAKACLSNVVTTWA
ncbi:uncharacterized protein LOC130495878 [Raphanus sativus]|uniref:Uncharacterized protein LOC130495878 n=1 Tax=Raphanus sativus TaxID=3726 RepID=A0A9W3BW02_RAPSA|nr:uncharacterized protein LOC130495878 [Raphanus sativus]